MSNLVAHEVERLVFTVSGPDAAKYLHSQLSNDIASLSVGESRYSFVLDPMGKIVSHVRVARVDEEVFEIDTELVEGLGDLLLARLNRFKIRIKADIIQSREKYLAIRSLDQAVVAPPTSAQVVLKAQWGDGSAIDVRLRNSEAVTFATDIPEDVEAEHIESLRIQRGWPAMGREMIAGETLPAATGLVPISVSFTKGCYPGQELVERMDSRGSTAPKTLRLLRGTDAVGLMVGEPVMVGGANVGIATSVAGDCALAYVARSVEIGEAVGGSTGNATGNTTGPAA